MAVSKRGLVSVELLGTLVTVADARLCSTAREDIGRTVWDPRRRLECGNLLHGGAPHVYTQCVMVMTVFLPR